MPEYNTKDILYNGIENTFLSLISDKINVLIIGGGRAGFIKAKTFSKNGCNVTVLSKEFCEEFKGICNLHNVKLIKEKYKKEYILNNHLIIIAVNDEKVNSLVKTHCNELFKLYLDCTNFKKGLFVVPCQRNTGAISFGINTKGGSPKTSRYLAGKVNKVLYEYNSFVEYNCSLRNRVKDFYNKDEIMKFVASDDFYFFYKKNQHENILKMFYYGGDVFEINSCH
ncbi:Precorrin-2 dehydrogenase [Clostridium liquoris]|jgi:precorrin-2 dehydrogenase/sirohydrochlorin ferrochelatase|uniref:precorrin-2 dehydrogenase n=1 Tax=Clostridium liquoris TaxID=1289519 RepID=A0A2T0B2Z9_9CLOT|nr:NAD(P)-dependent oxidoreductase [Clostridium liquoris]PRR78281.1 Precorrin-2 dehydrogenase [Clostridium liquoris]